MKAVRRFAELFRNSPTFGRDRANIISGITIGTTALLLNGVIMMMILPLMLDPDDIDFRMLTENMEFGQLLGLILLGGATAFATVLIPLRLASVFMAPRIGRYFDQIVLSGISPIRFLIGKVTSQNLFLALILFLLLPWFVLVLSLGGLEWPVFLGNLFLVWQYCMMLSLAMLWLSLYLNEVLAGLALLYVAAVLCAVGCAPLPWQPFVVTPFPALMYSVYSAVNLTDPELGGSYPGIFLACAAGMATVMAVSLGAIYLGPLYGITRDNSTFGEVVKAGDSKRRRRFRFRLHIQRPSELAFFYENRGDSFRKYEGLLRWGIALGFLLIAGTAAWSALYFLMTRHYLPFIRAGNRLPWVAYEFHTLCHGVHGVALILAVFLFSHARNTTYQRLPVIFGWKMQVSRMDSAAFGLFLLISTAVTIGIPLWIEQSAAIPAGVTLFPTTEMQSEQHVRQLDYLRLSVEGTLALSLCGVAVYFLQRTLCLSLWMKSMAMAVGALLYLAACITPMVLGAIIMEIPQLSANPLLKYNAPQLAMTSPVMFFLFLYQEGGPFFREGLSTAPFYLVQVSIIAACVIVMRPLGRRLRREYLGPLRTENK